ncbi:MAG: hypothetical protein EB127_23600, partial [Alphaproteobacteria bacterium]|nr:hypothetical protein [Alphaproteobacteria bacterium]
MAQHSNYWSCTPFADWLRGTPKGGAKTSEDWDEWNQFYLESGRTTATINNLQPNTKYYVRFKAWNCAGESISETQIVYTTGIWKIAIYGAGTSTSNGEYVWDGITFNQNRPLYVGPYSEFEGLNSTIFWDSGEWILKDANQGSNNTYSSIDLINWNPIAGGDGPAPFSALSNDQNGQIQVITINGDNDASGGYALTETSPMTWTGPQKSGATSPNTIVYISEDSMFYLTGWKSSNEEMIALYSSSSVLGEWGVNDGLGVIQTKYVSYSEAIWKIAVYGAGQFTGEGIDPYDINMEYLWDGIYLEDGKPVYYGSHGVGPDSFIPEIKFIDGAWHLRIGGESVFSTLDFNTWSVNALQASPPQGAGLSYDRNSFINSIYFPIAPDDFSDGWVSRTAGGTTTFSHGNLSLVWSLEDPSYPNTWSAVANGEVWFTTHDFFHFGA